MHSQQILQQPPCVGQEPFKKHEIVKIRKR